MPSDFHRLRPYQLSVALRHELREVIREWDKFDQWSLGLQLIRAVDSIAANIAEGNGRSQARDRRHFLVMARGSAREAEHWLSVAEDAHLLSPGTRFRTDEILWTLNGLIRRQRPE